MKRRLPLVLLAALVLAVFLPSLRNGFVWDDRQYLLENPRVTAGLTVTGLRWACTSFAAGNWHPLTWASHLLDVQLFGLAPPGHHLTSVLLHLGNTLLLFLLLRGLTGAAGRSLAVASLFAVHPLRVESVAWVAERKDLLAGAFLFLTLLAYLRTLRRPGVFPAWVVPLIFALGLATKPMLVTLPLVLLILDWWPLGRLSGRTFVPLLREKLPFLLLAAASAAVTLLAQAREGSVMGLESVPPPWRLANAAVSVLRYLGKTVWPADLAAFYPHPGRSLPLALGAAAGAALLTLLLTALRRRRREPWLAAGWLWFLGMLLPVSGLVQVGGQGMADRYTYLPLVGVFIAAAWGAAAGLGVRRMRVPLGAAAAGIIAVMGLLAFAQVRTWKDDTTLFSHAARVTGPNWMTESNLGRVAFREGRWQEAAARYRAAARDRGDLPGIHASLGLALLNLGDLPGARAAFERALALRPADPEAESNLGLALARAGRLEEAALRYRRALALAPESTAALLGLGVVLDAGGRTPEALELYGRAAALDPASPLVRFNLGTALARAGRLVEAEASYRAAVALDPGLAAARNNLANLLIRQGRREEALEQLRAAVAAAPDDPEIRANLLRHER